MGLDREAPEDAVARLAGSSRAVAEYLTEEVLDQLSKVDRGFLLSHDVRTGRQVYGRQRISAEAGGFTASPWAYNGKIFLLSEDGDTFVVAAGPEFKLIGKNSLNEMSLATPAVVRGSVLIRTQSKLYRIAKPQK